MGGWCPVRCPCPFPPDSHSLCYGCCCVRMRRGRWGCSPPPRGGPGGRFPGRWDAGADRARGSSLILRPCHRQGLRRRRRRRLLQAWQDSFCGWSCDTQKNPHPVPQSHPPPAQPDRCLCLPRRERIWEKRRRKRPKKGMTCLTPKKKKKKKRGRMEDDKRWRRVGGLPLPSLSARTSLSSYAPPQCWYAIFKSVCILGCV